MSQHKSRKSSVCKGGVWSNARGSPGAISKSIRGGIKVRFAPLGVDFSSSFHPFHPFHIILNIFVMFRSNMIETLVDHQPASGQKRSFLFMSGPYATLSGDNSEEYIAVGCIYHPQSWGLSWHQHQGNGE